MRLGRAIARLYDAESDLADEYRKVGDRHAVDHDVYYMCHSLAKQSKAHAEQLQPFAQRYGAAIRDTDGPEPWLSVMSVVRRQSAEWLGRSPKSGVLLLRDLRHLYLSATETEIIWWMVRQGAMAVRDADLAQLFQTCHEETWNQLKWIKTKIKESSAQVLVGG